MTHILAIDQGTTSSRAIVFDAALRPVATAQKEFAQHYPAPGWVEHDPEEIWETAIATCRAVLVRARVDPSTIAAIGIAGEAETTLAWDRETGKPLGRAIVWQDRRTASACAALRDAGHEPAITAAIESAEPPPSNPTSMLETVATPNCSEPIRAEALPARVP